MFLLPTVQRQPGRIFFVGSGAEPSDPDRKRADRFRLRRKTEQPVAANDKKVHR